MVQKLKYTSKPLEASFRRFGHRFYHNLFRQRRIIQSASFKEKPTFPPMRDLQILSFLTLFVCYFCLAWLYSLLPQKFSFGYPKRLQAWASTGGLNPLEFEVWHFPIKFLANNVVFLVSSGKMKFFQFWPHPGKIFLATPWKNLLLAPPPGKNPSDAHVCNNSTVMEELGFSATVWEHFFSSLLQDFILKFECLLNLLSEMLSVTRCNLLVDVQNTYYKLLLIKFLN